MGRMFIATINVVTNTTARDVVEIEAGVGFPVAVHEIYVSTSVEKDANEEQVELELARYDDAAGSWTPGTGGTAPNAFALDGAIGDTEDNAAIRYGATTQAVVGTGNKDIIGNIYANNRIGWHYLPAPEGRPHLRGGVGLVVAMTNTVTTTTAFRGYIIFEETVV